MRKNYKKLLAVSLSMSLAFGSLAFSAANTAYGNSATDISDGDIIINPWYDLYTTPADENQTTKKDESQTTKGDESQTTKGDESQTTKKDESQTNNNGETSSDKGNSGTKVDTITTANSQSGLSKVPTVKRAKIKKAVRAKNNKTATVKLKRIKGSNGYKIQYSTNKKFKKKATKTVYSKKLTKKIKKLKVDKKYYVRIKAYKTVGNKKYYSKKWSKVKILKVKK